MPGPELLDSLINNLLKWAIWKALLAWPLTLKIGKFASSVLEEKKTLKITLKN